MFKAIIETIKDYKLKKHKLQKKYDNLNEKYIEQMETNSILTSELLKQKEKSRKLIRINRNLKYRRSHDS